ncbi:hypothetical protein SLEP1_g15408 [Rubroshorea leprosula]|uniref:Non-specific lipid-transfer protein n=1 Tax=Rubroshorea leprosula TaxID=152421 RepID=A0AAV5IWG5_9ROSI|nr:hypothetical protein SLEP1_g15408 [Rubroshorea leprosula]
MASSGVLVGWLVLMCMVLCGLQAQAAVTCGDVVRNLTPCISYVSNGGSIPQTCCNGIKTLYSAAQTTTDRQTVCKCIKSAVNAYGNQYSNYNLDLAAGLPGKCGVNIPYKISPSTDCDKVN